jgi:hypothetical protein
MGGDEAIARVYQLFVDAILAGHLRLEGGCVAGDDMSSSRARLLWRLAAPAPRFADDMLERSGELEACLLVVWWGDGEKAADAPHAWSICNSVLAARTGLERRHREGEKLLAGVCSAGAELRV